MSGVATAIAGAAVIGAVASNSAANKQAKAAKNATQLQQNQWNDTRESLQPYMDQGKSALASLNSFLADPNNQSFTAEDFNRHSDPSYQWQLQQGQQALQNSQAAGDGVLSGAALKGMQNYTQGLASTNYQNAYTNWFNTTNQNYSRLAGMAQLGEGAAAGAGNIGANLAGTAASSTMAAGNAGAAGIMGASNAFTNGANNGAGYYMLSSMMNGNNGVGTTPISMPGAEPGAVAIGGTM